MLIIATAGCVQPPASEPQENTSFNISAVERDPVREAAAEAVLLPKDADPIHQSLPPFPEYYAFMNSSENRTYFDYLVHTNPLAYDRYRNLSLNMSFIEYLERSLSGYVLNLNHDTRYVPLWFTEVTDVDPSIPVIHLTNETLASAPLLKSYFIDGYPGFKVLPSEEWQLLPYRDAHAAIRKAYVEWNGTYYFMSRSIS